MLELLKCYLHADRKFDRALLSALRRIALKNCPVDSMIESVYGNTVIGKEDDNYLAIGFGIKVLIINIEKNEDRLAMKKEKYPQFPMGNKSFTAEQIKVSLIRMGDTYCCLYPNDELVEEIIKAEKPIEKYYTIVSFFL